VRHRRAASHYGAVRRLLVHEIGSKKALLFEKEAKTLGVPM
jgi:hypothetical protein